MKKAALLVVAFTLSLFAQDSKTPPPAKNSQETAIASAPAKTAPTAVKRTPEGNLILEDSTPIRLRTKRNLSSADCKTGDQIDFEVLDPVVLDGVTVIPQNGIAWGVVTEANPKRRMGRAGKLNIAIQSIKMANGEKANLRAVKDNSGGGHVGAMTGAMVATGIVFFPAAPLFLFMHGKDINIPQGTEFTAYVNGDFPFVMPASAAPPKLQAQQTAAPNVEITELTITSVPDGADIEVDGAFVGNTPATLRLQAGDHTIRISRKGYNIYEKKIRSAGGKATLRAELEAAGITIQR